LGQLVDLLRSKGQIAHHLTFCKGMDPSRYETLPLDIRSKLTNPRKYGHRSKYEALPCASYMGVFHSPCVDGKMRRVDIKWYSHSERVFAALYFTGNGYFNRAMRLWATRKFAYTLNDHGLFMLNTTTRVMNDVQTEQQVFDALGLQWKEVTERDGFDAVRGKGNDENVLQLQELSPHSFRQENAEHVWIR
jgi:hypothetical protein